MRNNLIVPVLILSSFLIVNCAGENRGSGAAQSDNAVDRQQIQNTIDATWDALEAQDLEQFQEHTLPNWRLFTARANKMSAEQLVNAHKKNLTDFNLEYSNLQIHLNDDMAWVTYDATLSGLFQGEEWGGEFIFTNILVRSNGDWKIAHMHESQREETDS